IIEALRNHRDVAGGDVLRDRRTFDRLELAAFVDIERDLAGRDLAGADAALDAQTAGRQIEYFTHRVLLQRDRAHRTGKAKADMDDIVAGREHEVGGGGAIFLDRLEHAGRIGLVAVDAPNEARANARRILAVAGAERDRCLPGSRRARSRGGG